MTWLSEQLIAVSWMMIMTQDEKWNNTGSWQLMNAGTLKPERCEMFEKLLASCEEYRRVNQYGWWNYRYAEMSKYKGMVFWREIAWKMPFFCLEIALFGKNSKNISILGGLLIVFYRK